MHENEYNSNCCTLGYNPLKIFTIVRFENMSASRERKERAQKSAAQPAKKEKKKLSEGWILAISVVLIVVVVFGAVLGIRYYQRNQTVLTVGDKEVTVKEFNFFYNQTVNNFSGYASYIGIDTGVALDKQNVDSESVSMMSMLGMDTDALAAYAKDDGSYDVTWAEYFAEIAKENTVQTYVVYQAAVAAGHTMSEEMQQSIDSELLNLDLYAQIYDVDTDEYIESVFGDGCDEAGFREYLEVTYLASDYISVLTYSQAEIDARYAESTEDFDVVSYLLYTVTTPDEEETTEETTEETEETTEETEKVDPEADAKAMEASFDVTNEAVTAYTDQVFDSAKAYTTEEAATWMFETAKPGDVKMFANTETGTYYVVKVLSNENYATVNALQIYIADDEEETTEETTEEATEEAELTALKTLEAITTSLSSDASEENFRALATEYSESDSVELTEASYAYISGSISKEAMMWTAEGRTAGDYEVFTVDGGTYIVYYLGEGGTYRDLSVNSMLVSEWLEEATEEAVAVCKYDADAAMNGNVGLVLSSES